MKRRNRNLKFNKCGQIRTFNRVVRGTEIASFCSFNYSQGTNAKSLLSSYFMVFSSYDLSTCSYFCLLVLTVIRINTHFFSKTNR